MPEIVDLFLADDFVILLIYKIYSGWGSRVCR